MSLPDFIQFLKKKALRITKAIHASPKPEAATTIEHKLEKNLLENHKT